MHSSKEVHGSREGTEGQFSASAVGAVQRAHGISVPQFLFLYDERVDFVNRSFPF